MTLAETIIAKIEANDYEIQYPKNGGGIPFRMIGQAFIGLYGDHILTVVKEGEYLKSGNRHIFSDAQVYERIKKALKDKADLGLGEDVEAKIIGWMS